MSGTSLAVKIGTLILGAGILIALFKRIKGLKKYGLASLFYVIIVSLLLALPTLLLLSETSTEVKKLILGQIFITVLGTLHVLLSKKLLPWYASQLFKMQIVFIIVMLIFGYLFSNLTFTFLVASQAQLVWTISLLCFLIPILLNKTINDLVAMPPKAFKKWRYPVGENIEDPSDEEMDNPVVISFVFYKNDESGESTTFRAKAPVAMSLGRLFYFFINDYNSRNPEAMISYLDENNEPDNWIFYKVKNRLLNTRIALDADESIYANNIKENDVLICTRFILTQKTTEDETTK